MTRKRGGPSAIVQETQSGRLGVLLVYTLLSVCSVRTLRHFMLGSIPNTFMQFKGCCGYVPCATGVYYLCSCVYVYCVSLCSSVALIWLCVVDTCTSSCGGNWLLFT